MCGQITAIGTERANVHRHPGSKFGAKRRDLTSTPGHDVSKRRWLLRSRDEVWSLSPIVQLEEIWGHTRSKNPKQEARDQRCLRAEQEGTWSGRR